MKINLLKTLMVSTLLASSTLFVACDEEAGIEVNIPQRQEVIYKIPPVTTTTLTKVDTLDSDLDSLLAQNKADREDIKSIAITNLSLAFTNASGVIIPTQNFNNVKSIGINIAEIGSTYTRIQGIDSTQMVNFRNVNPIVFPPYSETVNLVPFLTQPQFRVQLDGSLFAPTTDTLYIKSTMEFTITATL